jgi:hypothetical protein
MRHHEEEYYEAGKATRDKMQLIAGQILAGIQITESPAPDPIDALAQVNDVLKPRPRVPKKRLCTPPASPQLDLF